MAGALGRLLDTGRRGPHLEKFTTRLDSGQYI